MTRLGYRFSAIPEWVLEHPDLDGNAVRLFGLIAKYRVESYATVDELAEKCQCSPDTARRALRKLESVGAVRTEIRHNEKGGRIANRYIPAGDSPLQGSAQPPRKSETTPLADSGVQKERQEDLDKRLLGDHVENALPGVSEPEAIRSIIADVKAKLPRTAAEIDDHPYVDTTGKLKCDVCSFSPWLHKYDPDTFTAWFNKIVPAPSLDLLGEAAPAPSSPPDGASTSDVHGSEGEAAPARHPNGQCGDRSCPLCHRGPS